MIVGRDIALGAGERAVTSAGHGHGGLLLVYGEAGIGKTTVARAIAEHGRGAGAEVRWGSCVEGAVLPLGVWADCLRQPGGDRCATVAKRLEQGDLGADPGADAERQRERFFSTVVDALREVADRRPQVVVLEDLHWADAQSLLLLRVVAGHLPSMSVLVVGTYRDDELPPGSLAGIGGGATWIPLSGLRNDEVALLLHDVLGRTPSEDEIRTVSGHTGGNPLFVTEVARLLARGSVTTLPGGVRDVVGRRLARLSPACDRVLGAAAVLGATFEPAIVAEMLHDPDDVVLEALDEASAARVVLGDVDQAGFWHFAHELVRAARYEALGSAERRELHRRAVDVLAGRAGVPASVMAHHAGRARFDPGDPRPVELRVAAAGEALDRLAWEEAATLCRQALAAVGTTEPTGAVRAEAWLGLGDALLRGGDTVAAASAFESAAGIARDLGRLDLLARAALAFSAGIGSFEVRMLDRRQVQLLEEAAAVLPDGSPFRPLVLARLSVALAYVDTDDRRLAVADEAISLARRRGEPATTATAIAARCEVRAGPDHVVERLEAASEIVALAQQAAAGGLEVLGRRLRIVALFERRDLDAFDAEVAAYGRVVDRLGDPLYRWYVPLWRAMRAYADGRLDDAVRLLDEAHDMGRSAGSTNAELLYQAFSMYVAMDRRDTAGMDAAWAAIYAADADFAEVVASPVLMFVDARAGRIDRARVRLDRFGVSGLEQLAKDQEWLAAMSQIVVAAVAADHRGILRHAYDLLLPYAGVGVFEGIAAVDNGVVDRFLAIAAGRLGDAAAARRHVEAALAAVAGTGRLIVAHTEADCSRALAASTDDDDHRQARLLAERAATTYEALGCDALAAELRPLAAGTVAPATPAEAASAALVREGDTWAFTYGGVTTRVRHAKGVADLAVLLGRPGQEVHVRQLEGVGGAPSSAQPVLDDTAVANYRERLRDLEDELDEAERHADLHRTARLAAERDALVDQLTSAFGLRQRPRDVGADPDERLRKAVSARVKSVIVRLEELAPPLGRHLRGAVRTGYWCCYEPGGLVDWDVRVDHQAASGQPS